VDPDSKRSPSSQRQRSGRGGGDGLHVHVSDGRGRAVRDGGLSAWLSTAAPPHARGEVAIALVTDARIRTLNQQFRHKDTPTDVLSFPAASRTADPGSRVADSGPRIPGPGSRIPDTVHLGDIVIATGVARRQAREAGHSYGTELRVLALHGLLHLLGYDHDRNDDAGRMSRVETRLRRKHGLAHGLIERARSSAATGSPRRRGGRPGIARP
jgi:probable rRNA maturation factor